jgi:hypothetical protein
MGTRTPAWLGSRYSPSFIKGGQQIDGETIETLWAPLNKITRSMRGMSTLHHWEVIDDHMNDSNWKKIIDIGKFSFNDTKSTFTLVSSKFRAQTLPIGNFGGRTQHSSI